MALERATAERRPQMGEMRQGNAIYMDGVGACVDENRRQDRSEERRIRTARESSRVSSLSWNWGRPGRRGGRDGQYGVRNKMSECLDAPGLDGHAETA